MLFGICSRQNRQPLPTQRARRAPLRLEVLEDRLVPSLSITTLSLQTNDLVYEPVGGLIYASTPGRAGAIGNSIVPIDPNAATVGDAVFVGSEPGKLAISDDSAYIYVALNGAGAVSRFNIAQQMPDLQFSLGVGTFGTRFAEDLAVLPGNDTAVAISRRYANVSPRHAGVAIYDDGVQRPVVTADHTGSNSIAFSATADRLYGYNNETTEFGFRRMNVDDSGVTVADVTGGLIFGFNVTIKYDNGRIYSTHGEAVDPEAAGGPQLVGTYAGVGFASSVAPDSANDRIYFLTSSQLQEYQQSTFQLIATYSLPSGGGSLIRWGDNGLAYQDGNHVYLITITDDSPTSPAALVGAGLGSHDTVAVVSPGPPPASHLVGQMLAVQSVLLSGPLTAAAAPTALVTDSAPSAVPALAPDQAGASEPSAVHTYGSVLAPEGVDVFFADLGGDFWLDGRLS